MCIYKSYEAYINVYFCVLYKSLTTQYISLCICICIWYRLFQGLSDQPSRAPPTGQDIQAVRENVCIYILCMMYNILCCNSYKIVFNRQHRHTCNSLCICTYTQAYTHMYIHVLGSRSRPSVVSSKRSRGGTTSILCIESILYIYSLLYLQYQCCIYA